VRQINSVSRLEKVSDLLRRLLNNKSHIQSNHIPIFHKKKMPLIYQASFIFLSLKFPHPNTKLRRKIQAGKKIHRGVDCVKQLCEKYLSLAVEEEALALNSFKILVLIVFFFFFRKGIGQNSQRMA